jgi:hypothetical protein
VLLQVFILFWQLSLLFACCSGVGLALRPLLPKQVSFLHKALFCLMGGLFLVVLIPQNLIYLGVPVRISAWLLLGAALVQVWLCRHRFVTWIGAFCSSAETRTLAVLVFLTVGFHGVVPIRQGLEWYSGKGYPDYYNYILLAEFLKEEPYHTSEREIGLRPWLLKPATVLKKERIGQSIITAEMSVWSGTSGKGGYAATVIFFLTLLAICLYVLLRETGTDRFMAGSGALLAVFLPAVTRLSLDGFLSHVAILFVFPFLVSLLRRPEWSARSFTLLFSLTLAYVVSAYSEIAPIGFCVLALGVLFVRRDRFPAKRLMLMSAILLVALVNIYYLPNLIQFLGQQYYIAAKGEFLDNMAPDIQTLRGWSELIFGVHSSPGFALFFDYCAVLLGLLFLTGVFVLSRSDRLVFGAVLLPGLLVISYLATRVPAPRYPIAKITLTILPLVISLVFVALSQVTAHHRERPVDALKKLLAMFIVAAATAGSFRYYNEVINRGGLLGTVLEPRFLNVCRELEEMKNQRLYVFENDYLLTPWLCYYARHNDVYVDGSFIGSSNFSRFAPFSKVPDLKNIDFTVTPDRIVDLRVPSASSTP